MATSNMSSLLPSYLTTLRKQWGFTQPELAQLLGISASLLSKLESLDRRPTAKIVIAAELVFGRPAREIFPGIYREIEPILEKKARALQQKLGSRTNEAQAEKRRLMGEMVQRIGADEKVA